MRFSRFLSVAGTSAGQERDVNRHAARAQIREHLLGSIETKRRVLEACPENIARAAELMAETFRRGGKILLCGNGGSAADCQHMAAELVSSLRKDVDRPGLPAIALTTDTSLITAFSNDHGFHGIFARQVQALGHPDDILIGISTSGESRNVLEAAVEGRRRGLRIVTLTGEMGKLSELADVAIRVPDCDTQHVQEAHVAIEHMLCHLVECHLHFARQTPRE